MRTALAIVALAAGLGSAPAFAQDPPPTASTPRISGTITTGGLQSTNDTNSSKLTEYRDLHDSFLLSGIRFAVDDWSAGRYFDFVGVNVSRADQTLLAEGGRAGVWQLQATWIEVPHGFSNKALSPYLRRAPGLFEVPATIPITFKKLATAGGDAPGVVASDALVAAYQASFLAATPLATDTNAGRLALRWTWSETMAFSAAYDRREKSGLKSTFGPIGDRPPRTLNIELTEPVDYRTNDVTLSAEHAGKRYEVRVDYQFSDFANEIDVLQWQNVYTTAAPGATYDLWDRAVSVYGRRPLPPDNRYHHIAATVGGDLPFDSRLTATAAFGRLDQNGTLLPYSYNNDLLAVDTLPRETAEADIRTMHWLADYVVNPTSRLNLRASIRYFGLDNRTPEDRWEYVTSDTSNLNGTTSFKNRRINLAYEYDRTNLGLDATYRLPAKSTIVLGYEREDVSREFREASTGEDRLSAAFRTRAAPGLQLRVRYLFGNRDGGTYDGSVTRQSYWYARSAAGTDNDNPAYTFSNHPDMRRYDVSDRGRQQVDVTMNYTPGDVVALSAFARYRKDDFDSDVAAVQPLLGAGVADELASTPGDQLGRLDDARFRYGVDMFAQPNARLRLNGFLNFDRGASLQRSLEFNENNKQNPSAVATAALGPWTRAGSQWTADFKDRTWSGGVGATMQVIPNRLDLTADYTVSLADVDVTYAGFGVTNWEGTAFPANHEFAFSSPPTVREDLRIISLRSEISIGSITLLARYSYETYTLDDWQQSAGLPWVETVGADTFLRDTSRSHQWGNRLFNLGTTLAPSYKAHITFVGFRYRF